MRENTPKPADIDLNPEFRRALEIMEEGRRNVFITGRAGTGKSTLLQVFSGKQRQEAGRPRAHGGCRRQRGRADHPFLLRVQARRDARGDPPQDQGQGQPLPETFHHRHRRDLDGAGGPPGLRGQIPAAERPRSPSPRSAACR